MSICNGATGSAWYSGPMVRSILNLVVALASAVINLAAAALSLLILIILYALVQDVMALTRSEE